MGGEWSPRQRPKPTSWNYGGQGDGARAAALEGRVGCTPGCRCRFLGVCGATGAGHGGRRCSRVAGWAPWKKFFTSHM